MRTRVKELWKKVTDFNTTLTDLHACQHSKFSGNTKIEYFGTNELISAVHYIMSQ